jgi:predicted phosphodiesterase
MVRTIIFGDVNQNYKDLYKLLIQSSSLSVDKYICHGDIPTLPWRFDLEATQKCIDLIRQYDVKWILGNHEQDILARAESLGISKSLANRLRNLPKEIITGEAVIKHHSPEGLWRIAKRHSEFDYLQKFYPKQRIVVFGHSHRRCHHKRNGYNIDSNPIKFNMEYDVSEGLHLINTGAIHRLSSFNWKKGYVFYDSDKQTISFKKIEE